MIGGMRQVSVALFQDQRGLMVPVLRPITNVMNATNPYLASQRPAGILLLIAAPTALISFFLLPAAFGWDFDLLFDPYRAIAHAGADLTLYRWGWLLDIPGYYLLTLPSMLVLRARMDGASPMLRDAALFCGLGYLLIGTSGAAILASCTDLFTRHAAGTDAVRVAVTELHASISRIVMDGLWNTIAMILFAAWALITGFHIRPWNNPVGIGLAIVGALAISDVLGGLFHLEGLAMAGLYGYLFLFPAWCILAGARLLRQGRDLAA